MRNAEKREGRINQNSILYFNEIVISLVFFFLCVIPCQRVFSQSLSGTVIDKENSEPLANCYLFIKNYPEFSWISDSAGKFSIKYPESLKSDTLVVSFLGYKSKEVPLLSINSSVLEIELNRLMISLDEVLVMPETVGLENLIHNILENIEINYPNQRHQLTGGYRKISTDYNEFTGLIEATVTIEDVGYSKDISNSKIQINSIRSGDELAEVDLVFLDYYNRLKAKAVDETGVRHISNVLVDLYRNNPLRGAYYEDALFTENGLQMTFIGIPEMPVYHEIVGYEVIEKDTVYQIAFGSTDPPLGSTYIKVNSRDFAVLEIQQKIFTNADRTDYIEMIVKYRKFEGRYYPEKIVQKKMRFISRDIGGHSMDIHTYWFDEVKTGKFKKIRFKDAEKAGENVRSQHEEYNPDLWNQSEILKNHPLDSAIIKSLERYRSLQEQFKSNGKN